MALAEYAAKRRFDQTPEPKGKKAKPGKFLHFVVQKHQASRLHYDFRLELDGVLKSWAVPKGPSLTPRDKRLAMMVEDHPLDYRGFEGVIPKGNYGAGNVIVWDQGNYTAANEPDPAKATKLLKAGLKKGELKFVLNGQKLKGLFALVKIGDDENSWLLIKDRDEYASDEDVTRQDKSVISGRTVEEAADSSKKWLPDPDLDLTDAPSATLPQTLAPMLATLADAPFDRDDWVFEVKWDGYRILARIEDGQVRLLSRNGKDYTAVYQPVAQELANLRTDCWIDGEMVVVDDAGRSSFQALQRYQETGRGNLVYYAFDLPFAAGHDLRQLPLTKRQSTLAKLIEPLSQTRLSEHIDKQGISFYQSAVKAGLEGIMAKDSASPYETGRRSRSWLKVKNVQVQEAVIGGYTEPQGGRKYFGALVLGVYDEAGKLHYIGHTGGGFDDKTLRELYPKLAKLERKTSAFDGDFKTNAPVHWVKPTLVAEVKFAEWTGDGHLRQPIFLGLRDDKDPLEVTRELPQVSPAENGGPEIKHLDKVFWPKEGYTKGDVLEYYRSVADFALPYLKDRPQSLNRHPNGIEGASFYQKNLEKHPDWIQTFPYQSDSEERVINYLVCSDLPTLEYLVNLGCIELHPWHSRIQSPEKPDYMLIDLDAKTTGFKDIIKVARVTHEILDELKVPSVVKTSGKTGLHICVPLSAQYSYDQSRQFCELILQLVNRRLPKITSLERNPDKRQGKVYLDFLQNRRGQTMAAAYCLRPVAGAPASTPLDWSEVKPGLDPSRFTIKTAPKRFGEVGDLWRPVLAKGIDMAKVLKDISNES